MIDIRLIEDKRMDDTEAYNAYVRNEAIDRANTIIGDPDALVQFLPEILDMCETQRFAEILSMKQHGWLGEMVYNKALRYLVDHFEREIRRGK